MSPTRIYPEVVSPNVLSYTVAQIMHRRRTCIISYVIKIKSYISRRIYVFRQNANSSCKHS